MKQTLFEQLNRMRTMSSLPLITEEVFYEQVLNEDNRYDWLYKTYGDKIKVKYLKEYPYENEFVDETVLKLLKSLIGNDPTSITVPETGEIKKAGKYSQWIIKVFLYSGKNITRFMEDIYKIKEDLKLYNRIKHRLPEDSRDINKLTNEVELYELIKHFRREDLRSKSEKKGDIETIYDGDDFHMLIPKTREAACSWGAGTRWCTASPGLNFFEDYTEDGPLYIISHKLENFNGDDIFQFHFETNQFMNPDDYQINLKEYFEEFPTIYNAFRDKFIKENNTKNLIKMGEEETVFKMNRGSLRGFDRQVLYKLYHKGLIKDATMNKVWKNPLQHSANVIDNMVWKNKKLYLVLDEWCNNDLNELFHSDYAQFAERLLCGEAYDDFYDYSDISVKDKLDGIDEHNMDKIKELSIGFETEDDINSVTKDNIDDMDIKELILDEVDWGEIKDAILRAGADTDRSLQEGAYYEAYTNLISNKLGDYQRKKGKLYFNITDYDEWYDKFIDEDEDVEPNTPEEAYNNDILEVIISVVKNTDDYIVPDDRGYWGYDEMDMEFNEHLSYHLGEL